MDNSEKQYIAIDLKSFYASVECVERGLDPLTTNLVVADPERTEKTICLAVSPSLKKYGIPGRARLFEVLEAVRRVNVIRQQKVPGSRFTGSSFDDTALMENPSLELSFVTAPPRMSLYMRKSTEIYQIYLKYIAPEDIHVYSVDEVFIDASAYLRAYCLTAHELAKKLINAVLEQTGITATAGIGTNLYLCKVAMDIVAKHIPADEDGVRIARLDELSYRRKLWTHTPLTDFWRVGKGYARRLQEIGLNTMGDIARCSLGAPGDYYNEDLLYKLFGVNAELLIDHAWGWEPCTIADIKAYRPDASSIGSGQVLSCPYDFAGGRMILQEMTESLALTLVEKKLVTPQLVLTVCYDIENLQNSVMRKQYKGSIVKDRYDRPVPKPAHGTVNLDRPTSSTRLLTEAALRFYDSNVHPKLLVRRVYITAEKVIPEETVSSEEQYEQLSLFTDYEAEAHKKEQESKEREKEKKLQQLQLSIRKRFGENMILRGSDLQEGATAMTRGRQIGGHRA